MNHNVTLQLIALPLCVQAVLTALSASKCMHLSQGAKHVCQYVRVVCDPRMDMCRVVMTPHVAGVTELSYRTMAQVVANEVRRHAKGLPPTIQLNAINQAVPDAL